MTGHRLWTPRGQPRSHSASVTLSKCSHQLNSLRFVLRHVRAPRNLQRPRLRLRARRLNSLRFALSRVRAPRNLQRPRLRLRARRLNLLRWTSPVPVQSRKPNQKVCLRHPNPVAANANWSATFWIQNWMPSLRPISVNASELKLIKF